ncbi:MAG TPA: universal stress protein, partial [Verrucomicrobiota bacterium]|nr:universal stress protein [Verrucomicrobiota bacterium]
QHAAWAALRLQAGVEVLHVLVHHREHSPIADLSGAIGMDASVHLTEELTRVEEAQGREARLKGKAILEDARQQLKAAGVTDLTLTQRHGEVVETLVELEPRAELIVVGKSGEHAVLAEGQVGGHLENLVRLSVRPVLVAERAFQPIRRFLLAYDHSPSARKAVDYVAASPLLRGLECQLVMVGLADAAHETALQDARDRLARAGYTVTAQLLPGRAAAVIADQVKSAHIHLLVMGAYGHSQLREFFVGSTTTKLVHTCPVSVLMFR